MKAIRGWRAYVAAALVGGLGGAWLGGVWQEPRLEERLHTAELELVEQHRRQAGVEQYAKLSQEWQALTQEEQGSAAQHSRACKGYGDCLFLGAQYEQACAAYREALRWNGDNEGARLNLCLAMERLPQAMPPPPQQQPPATQGQKPPQQPPKDPGQQPPDEPGQQPPGGQDKQPPGEQGKQPPGGGEAPPAEQGQQPPGKAQEQSATAQQVDAHSQQPAPAPSSAPDSSRQLLRHLVEQERDRSGMNIDSRDLKPPRGTETW